MSEHIQSPTIDDKRRAMEAYSVDIHKDGSITIHDCEDVHGTVEEQLARRRTAFGLAWLDLIKKGTP